MCAAQRAATRMTESETGRDTAIRTTTDTAGVTWTFRVVLPARVERRIAERRAHASADVTAERRTGAERRGRQELRVRLPEEFAHGWLLIESSTGERRRLAPIPPDWQLLSDTRLALLARVAGTPATPDADD